MAEDVRPDAGQGAEQPDPITSSSLSFPYLIASLLLMASLGWALYDEYFATRPWKDYQHRFSNVAAENHGEAIQKVTEGLGKKLPGHVITKIHAETPKQAGGAKQAEAKPNEKSNEAKA